MEGLIEEVLFVLAGEIDGSFGDAGILGDLIDRRLLEAEAGESPDRRPKDALFALLLH